MKEIVGNEEAVSATVLQTPSLRKGEGYEIVWEQVEGAEYYLVTDDNSHLPTVRTQACAYTPQVVGAHTVTVWACSDDAAYADSKPATIETLAVKPIWAYQCIRDGHFRFTKELLESYGLRIEDCEGLDECGRGRVYVDVDGNFTMDGGKAKNWTDEKYIGAHIDMLKECGLNVVLTENHMGGQFEENDVWETCAMKRIMDAAWARGMKVIVADSVIHGYSRNISAAKEEIDGAIAKRLADGGEAANYVKHPAFFGFMLLDEPVETVVRSCLSDTVKALRKAAKKLGRDNPFMHAGLTIAYSQYWEGLESFKNYLRDWCSYTACDHVCFNLYTNNVIYMGERWPDRYPETYEALMEVIQEYGGADFFQTLTAWNEIRRNDVSDIDVYMSMLYVAAHGGAGYSWFNYFPVVESSDTIEHTMVDYNGVPTPTYQWVKEANEQFVRIQRILDGYTYEDRQQTDEEKYPIKHLPGMNFSYFRSVTTTFKDESGQKAVMKVNALSMTETIGEKLLAPEVAYTVSAGNTYYILGNKGIKKRLAVTATEIVLSMGQGVLEFFNEEK